MIGGWSGRCLAEPEKRKRDEEWAHGGYRYLREQRGDKSELMLPSPAAANAGKRTNPRTEYAGCHLFFRLQFREHAEVLERRRVAFDLARG